MSAQLSYAIKQAEAVAGLIHGVGPRNVISRDVETAAGIGFAVAVSRGTDPDRQCVVGSADFIGITIRDLGREAADDAGAISYAETETAGIINDGYVWAVCPTGCVPGDPVNCVTATGVLDSGAPVAGEHSLDDAYWDSTAAAGELGLIRITGIATTAGV